jgi:hypothetical protein
MREIWEQGTRCHSTGLHVFHEVFVLMAECHNLVLLQVKRKEDGSLNSVLSAKESSLEKGEGKEKEMRGGK